jgi:hypothetical protein
MSFAAARWSHINFKARTSLAIQGPTQGTGGSVTRSGIDLVLSSTGCETPIVSARAAPIGPYGRPAHIIGFMDPLITPDGRYLVVRGRLWRATNPHLGTQPREHLVHALMDARRAIKAAKASGDEAALAAARHAVDSAKRGLGERGPVWWTDGAPDLNRHLVKNTPYADWFNQVD